MLRRCNLSASQPLQQSYDFDVRQGFELNSSCGITSSLTGLIHTCESNGVSVLTALMYLHGSKLLQVFGPDPAPVMWAVNVYMYVRTAHITRVTL